MLATASLVFAACASDDDDGDDAVTEETSDDTATTEAEGDDTATTMAEGDDTATTMAEGDDTATTTADTESTEPEAGAVGEVGGSACGTPHGPYEDSGEPAGEVRAAWNDPPLTFNNFTTHGNATASANVLYLMQAGGFSYFDDELNLINNDSFGTCVVDSLDPLQLTYTINEGVTWSDGVQVDAADMLLQWAAQSGIYNEGGSTFLGDGTAVAIDADGNILVEGPDGTQAPEAPEMLDEEGELLEGYSYVPGTTVEFDAASEAMALVTEVPTISDDGLSITFTYDKFYVDYPYQAPAPAVAAHVVAGRALSIDDPAEAKAALIAAFTDNDAAAVGPIAAFWNTGFDTTSLPDDEGLYLGYGPYNLTAYEETSQLTFEARSDYTWGPQPKVATIVYSIIGDPAAAVQALANEEVDVIQPQATADFLTQLEGYADRGIVALSGNTAVYEHVDFAQNNNGPFDPATYGGDEETAKMVRQAVMKTIPRQDIIDRLIIPLNPDAEIRNSFTVDPGAPLYEQMVAENGSDAYADVDIEGAIQLLADAGVTTPLNVRVLFADNNPRRAAEFDLMRDSAALAGITLVDGRSATWSSELGDTTAYDMVFFGWQSTSTAIGGSNANYITDGANNFYGYSNTELDAIFDELNGTTDPDAQNELLIQAEQILWEDAFGTVLFQHPGLTAYNENYVSGIAPIPLSPTIFWNVWDWEAA
jgi:peptide/nickel transport system substrate-binding protein